MQQTTVHMKLLFVELHCDGDDGGDMITVAGVDELETELLNSIHLFTCFTTAKWSRRSSISIVSDYGLDDRAIQVRSPAEEKGFSSSLCPDRLWGPPSLLYYGYRGSFPRAKRRRGVALITHPRLVPRS
jgi:hypothetical protein